MKTCIACGDEFVPRGRQTICTPCRRATNAVRIETKEKVTSKAQPATDPEPKVLRPLEKFGRNRPVFPGQLGVRIIRRGT